MNKPQARIEALECTVAWLIKHLASGDYFEMAATDQDNEKVAVEIIKIQDLLQRKIDRAEKGEK